MNSFSIYGALRPDFDPLPAPEAVVLGPQARFTVLTSRLIRMEYSRTNTFEDRASQTFWHRRQPPPPFRATSESQDIEMTGVKRKNMRYLPLANQHLVIANIANLIKQTISDGGILQGFRFRNTVHRVKVNELAGHLFHRHSVLLEIARNGRE